MSHEPTYVGHYEIHSELGRGGMGVVYRARDLAGREVAVKCIAVRDAKAARRLLREATVRVVHPNVVRIVGAGLDVRGEPYVVTELLHGETFRRALQRGGSVEQVAGWLAQAAEGLAALHDAGIIHRDVKPSNLFVTSDGTLKVLDFGAAAFADQSAVLTQAGTFLGTPAYLSPEQASGARVDGRADVWALGMCLYEALGGGLPFARATPQATALAVQHDPLPPLASRAPSVPTDLARLVERCLEKRPDDRVQTAAQLARQLWAHAGVPRPAAERTTAFAPRASSSRERVFEEDDTTPMGRIPTTQLGSITLGPFVLEDLVGHGGMAVVYRARHPDGTRVAIKIPLGDDARVPRFVAAMHDEARAIAALEHPSVVRIYDYGVVPESIESVTGGALHAGVPWIATEWAAGGTLQEQPLPAAWGEARATIESILGALAHVHARGIIHRDLKPANVLRCVERNGTTVLRLTDFGFVLGRDTTARLQGGTPAYMAPEQWEDREREQGPWTDLYALGVLAWRLVTGAVPSPTAERKLAPRIEIPAKLDAWLTRLLARDTKERFQRAADALRALEELETGRARAAELPPSWRALEHQSRPYPANVGRGLVHLRPVPIAGRTYERDVLWSALSDVVTTGRPRAVALVGAAGLGKTRLVGWLQHRAAELGVADFALVTHHEAFERGDGIVAMLARALRIEGLGTTDLDAAIADALPDLAREDQQELAALLRGDTPLESPRREDRRTLVARALMSLQRGRPIVLGIDDAQWGEEAIELAKDLLDRDAPVLVVLTARDDGLAERAGAREAARSLLAHQRATPITLGPLTPDEHADLLRQLLGLEATAALLIGTRTGGNPGFAVELVVDYLRSDVLQPSSEGFRLAYPDPDLPADLAATWRVRADRVLGRRPPDDARAIEIAALLGESPDEHEWSAACAAARVFPSSDLIDALVEERLVRRLAEGRWAFAHGMLREALLALAAPEDLAAHHRACVEALRARPKQEARIGRHLLAAGNPDEAIEPLLVAIDRAAASGDYASTAAALAYAEDAAARFPPSRWERGAVRLRRVMVAKWACRFDDVTRECESLIDDVERYGWPDLAASAWSYLADMRHREGDYEGAFAALDAAEASRPEGALLAGVRWRRAWMLMELGRLDEAEDTVATVIADPETPRTELVTARRIQAIVLRSRGRATEAARVLEETLGLAQGLRWHVAQTLSDLGDARRATGEIDEADRSYRDAHARFRALAAEHNAAVVDVNRAVVAMIRGAWAEAIELVARAVPILERRGQLPALAGAHAVAIVAHAARGEWEELDHHAERVTQQLEAAKHVDPDLLDSFERAATIAFDAGQTDRAARMAALAEAQRRALKTAH